MKKPEFDSKMISYGITTVLSVICCIVFFMIIQRWSAIRDAAVAFTRILTPFIWGAVIAYILRPMMTFFQQNAFAPLTSRIFKTEKGRFTAARALAVLLSLVLSITLIILLVWLIASPFYESIRSIVLALPGFIQTSNDRLLEFLANYPELEEQVRTVFNAAYTNFNNWLTNDLQPQMKDIVDILTASLRSVMNGTVNLFIGIIVSIYLLMGKEKFAAQFKRILYSAFSVQHAEMLLRGFSFVDRVFMDFFGGKLLDSAIVGLLCYIGCSVLKMPYALLISVIVGVTNIIPYFGPFIGAVPSAFFILMVSPMKCLIFLIFIVALQQLDGNVIGPHILGNSVGISGFWVMFAIIVGSGLFGFVGMLIGVPVFVVLSTLFNRVVEHFLKKRGLPTETTQYTLLDHMDPKTHEPVKRADESLPEEILEELSEEP